jgi:hypothetical protein
MAPLLNPSTAVSAFQGLGHKLGISPKKLPGNSPAGATSD